MNASYVFSQTNVDNAIYDPKHSFLRSTFNFAKNHLNRSNPNAKFIVIFSDIGDLLNINEINIIEKLAEESKLKITLKKEKLAQIKPSDNIDPLKNFKKESKVLLYELQRVGI